jgi:hypothetical protein
MPDTTFTRLDYFNVDPNAASERKDFLTEQWAEYYKDIDVHYGIYNSTVAAPAAIFSQAAIESINKWRGYTQLTQLLQAVENGEDDTYLTEFLANYGVTRRSGDYATGVVRLTFSRDAMYSVGPSDNYTARNILFHPSNAYSILPSNRTAYTGTELVLRGRTDNTYFVDVPFVADSTGLDANLAAGVELLSEQGIGGLLSAIVVQSFSGGEDQETAQELVNKIINGISSPVLSTRASMTSLLTKQTAFQPVYDNAVIGAGDVEMTRDKHSVFPLSLGGKCDWYVKTSKTIQTKTISVKAQLIRPIDERSAVWRMRITGQQAAGVYQVKEISHRQFGDNLEITSVERDFTLNDLSYKPDIFKAEEAAYSAYQQYVVEFVDPSMDRYGEVIPNEEEYSATVSYVPGIYELQEWASDPNNRSIYGDIVVKAVLPAIVSVGFNAVYKKGQDTVDPYVLQATVSATVKSVGITNGLAASVLYDSLQEKLPTGAHIENMIMKAELYLPDRVVTAVSREFLNLYYPPYGTEHTITFYCEPEDVAVATSFMI